MKTRKHLDQFIRRIRDQTFLVMCATSAQGVIRSSTGILKVCTGLLELVDRKVHLHRKKESKMDYAFIGTMETAVFKNCAGLRMKKSPNAILMADVEEKIAIFSTANQKLHLLLLFYPGGASRENPFTVKGDNQEEVSEDKERQWKI